MTFRNQIEMDWWKEIYKIGFSAGAPKTLEFADEAVEELRERMPAAAAQAERKEDSSK